MAKPKAHRHVYVPNTNAAGGYACRVCGFRIPAAHLPLAISKGAGFEVGGVPSMQVVLVGGAPYRLRDYPTLTKLYLEGADGRRLTVAAADAQLVTIPAAMWAQLVRAAFGAATGPAVADLLAALAQLDGQRRK